MINILRKNQKALWIVIAFLCVPFVFYFSNSNIGAIGNDRFGTIYGRSVPVLEFQRNARLFNLARDLGMFTFLQDMVAGADSQEEAYSDFTWNRLILRHEADRLGIKAPPQEVVKVVKGLRAFQGQNGFDIARYNEFTQTALPAMGFTDAQIEELAADQLTLERLKELIGTGVQIPEAESKDNYERAHGRLDVGVVRLRTEDVAKDINITEEDVSKYYEGRKAELNTEEKRQVSFVSFGLSEEQKKLAGKERVEVLQKLADRANDFSQALLEPGADFNQVAAKFELPVQATGNFTKIAPDPLLSLNPQLTPAAFRLTPQDPNTDPMQVTDSFYVLHLNGVEAAQPLTLDEARPQIMTALKEQRSREFLATAGATVAQKLRESLKSGAPLEAAAQQAGYPLEKIPPFTLSDPPARRMEADKPPQPEAPDLQMVKGKISEMNPGEVSEFLPTESGGVVAILEKRDQPAPEGYAAGKDSFNSRFLQNKQEIAFHEWLRERRRDAGVKAQTAPGAANAAG